MKYIWLIFMAIFWFGRGTSNLNAQNTSVKRESDSISIEREKVIDTVRHFFKWYEKNYDVLRSYNLIPMSKKEKIYRVDFNAVNSYLTKLRSCGMLDSSYIEYWHNFFVKEDKFLKKDKEKDGQPQNYTLDLILKSNEIDEVALKELESPEICGVIVNDGEASLVFSTKTFRLVIELIPVDNNWRIFNITPA